MEPPAKINRDRWFIWAVVGLAALVRLYRLGGQSLWIDELFTFTVSSPKAGLSIWDYLIFNLHGPFHSFIVYLFQLVSRDEAWLRLPSAVAGVGAVYFFYVWIRDWLGRNLARIATVILALHPLHIHYSQELRNYSFLFFFAVLASYFFHRYLTRNRRRDAGFYIVATALGALSNFTAAFFFIAHTLIFFFRRGLGLKSILRWAVIGLAVLILISPWVYRIYKVIDVTALVTPVVPGEIAPPERLRGETTVTLSALPFTAYTFSVGFSFGPSLRELHLAPSMSETMKNHVFAIVWIGLLFGVLLVTGLKNQLRDKSRLLELLIYLITPLLLTFLLCWQNAKAFNVRYVFFALPPFICLVAAGIGTGPRRLNLLLAGTVLASLLISLQNYYFDGRYAKEDVRSAAAYLNGQAGPGECILVPTVKEVFQFYYHRDNPVFELWAPPGTSKQTVEKRLASLFARCDSFWYLRTREWVDDPDGHLQTVLSESWWPGQRIEYDGVTLTHYRKKIP